MDISAHPLFVGVDDYLVFEPAPRKIGVQVAFVGHELCFGGYNCVDLARYGPTVSGGDMLCMDAASLALDHAEYWFLVVFGPFATLIVFAANIRLIGLDCARKQAVKVAIGHCFTDAMV